MVSPLTRLAALLLLAAPLAASPAYAQAKPPLTGLVTMGQLKFIGDPSLTPDNSLREVTAHPGVYVGAAVLATWKQLEPQSGTYDFSVIDSTLDRIRAYNVRYPATPLKAKLRVFAGANAPDWIIQESGGPIAIQDKDRNLQIGRPWARTYRAAWKRLQNALAARYDTDPLMQEVAISSCTYTSAEPFHIPLAGGNIQALLDAGYTNEAVEACLTGAVDDYAAWTHVALDFTFNPFRIISNGQAVEEPGFTESVMRDFRQRLGGRAVIGFHGLQPTMPAMADDMLDQLKSLGPPIEFQTRGTKQDMGQSWQTGLDYGMTEFEIWDTKDAGGSAKIDADQLHQWSAALHAR